MRMMISIVERPADLKLLADDWRLMAHSRSGYHRFMVHTTGYIGSVYDTLKNPIDERCMYL